MLFFRVWLVLLHVSGFIFAIMLTMPGSVTDDLIWPGYLSGMFLFALMCFSVGWHMGFRTGAQRGIKEGIKEGVEYGAERGIEYGIKYAFKRLYRGVKQSGLSHKGFGGKN